jgi:hypothetical protein
LLQNDTFGDDTSKLGASYEERQSSENHKFATSNEYIELDLPTHTQALFVAPPHRRTLRNQNSLRFVLAKVKLFNFAIGG